MPWVEVWGKGYLSFPRRWFRGHLHSGARGCEGGLCVPRARVDAAPAGRAAPVPAGTPRDKPAAPGPQQERRSGPGPRRRRRSHSPRASAAWWGAGWGRSSCCRDRRRCTNSGRCRPAAIAASGWNRSSRIHGSRAGPPAGLRRQRGQEAGWGRAAPAPPRKTPRYPWPQGWQHAARLPARALPHGSLCSAAKSGAGRPWSLSSVCPILLQPWGALSETPGKSRRWCCRPSPSHLPSVSKDLVGVRSYGQVGLGPLTPPFRLFPSVSKLKSIIISVPLAKPSRPYSINTDHWPLHRAHKYPGTQSGNLITFIPSNF